MNNLRRILVLALVLHSASVSFAQPSSALRNGPKVLQVFRAVVARPSESTVRVLADGREVAFGTVVDANGWILTKWSEIEFQRDKIGVRLKDGTVLRAEIKGVMDGDKAETAYDLAMLKVAATNLTPIVWANPKEAKVGRWVASPGLGANPVAVGVISVAARKYKLGDQPPTLDLAKSGYLGVAGIQDAKGGVKVGGVTANMPAEKAGLKANDIIYEVAGHRVNDTEMLINAIGRHRPGDEILLRVKRGEEDLEIAVKLAQRPKELKNGNPQETMGTTLSRRRGGFPIILQHDSGVRPRDCGGPLIDLDGHAVGINIARAGRTETYAIPAEAILPLLADLKSGKFAPEDEVKGDIIHKTTSFHDKDTLDKKRAEPAGKRYVRTEEVKLSKDVTYIIDMVARVAKGGKQIDPYLILEDANGKELAHDDDSGGAWNARIVFRAPADGTYRIVCTTFNPNETGSYTLTVRRQKEMKEKK